MDSNGKRAGKGALIQEELSATLGVNQDQFLFQEVYVVDMGGGKSSSYILKNQSPTLTTTHYGKPTVAYAVENHPADSRVDIDESGTIQTLTSRMGTGGGNVPMILETFSKERRAKDKNDFETWREGGVANTLNTFDNGDVRATDLVIEAYGVPLSFRPENTKLYEEKSTTITNGTNPGHHQGVVLSIDRAAFNQGDNAMYDFSVTDGGGNSDPRCKRSGCYMLSNGADIVGALCARDKKGVGNEYVDEGKVVIRRIE